MAGGGNGSVSVEERLVRLYEQAESETAKAFERMASMESFGRLLALGAENAAALARIGADLADLVLRNLRIASRGDVVRLARQLHRAEDKLERVLQEVEALRDELLERDRALADRRDARSPGMARPAASSGRRGARAPSLDAGSPPAAR